MPGLKAAGIVDKGMIPKVDSAIAAIKSGVEKVSFVDGRVPHSVMLEIFTDKGIGTEIVLLMACYQLIVGGAARVPHGL